MFFTNTPNNILCAIFVLFLMFHTYSLFSLLIYLNLYYIFVRVKLLKWQNSLIVVNNAHLHFVHEKYLYRFCLLKMTAMITLTNCDGNGYVKLMLVVSYARSHSHLCSKADRRTMKVVAATRNTQTRIAAIRAILFSLQTLRAATTRQRRDMR